jgi:hypothetical protein
MWFVLCHEGQLCRSGHRAVWLALWHTDQLGRLLRYLLIDSKLIIPRRDVSRILLAGRQVDQKGCNAANGAVFSPIEHSLQRRDWHKQPPRIVGISRRRIAS